MRRVDEGSIPLWEEKSSSYNSETTHNGTRIRWLMKMMMKAKRDDNEQWNDPRKIGPKKWIPLLSFLRRSFDHSSARSSGLLRGRRKKNRPTRNTLQFSSCWSSSFTFGGISNGFRQFTCFTVKNVDYVDGPEQLNHDLDTIANYLLIIIIYESRSFIDGPSAMSLERCLNRVRDISSVVPYRQTDCCCPWPKTCRCRGG